jgi:type IV pilus assembly protein PilA
MIGENKMKKQMQQGFTLIELMIVVAIIGILAAVAIPAYQDYIARSQMSEAMTLTSGLKTNVSEVFSQNGTCPTNGNNGIAAASDISGNYVAQVATGGTGSATGGCTIVATMKSSGVSTGIQGKTLTLTLTTAAQGGSYEWACTSNATQNYLPSSCASTAGGN